MSGTSMDGLDITYCRYEMSSSEEWNYQLFHAQTVKYTNNLIKQLSQSKKLTPEALCELDKKLAIFFSEKVNSFIEVNNIDKDLITCIASHGHTVFHQPDKGFTLQIGCGETLSYLTQLPVVNNFRQKDVTAGGQGAPLVPIGDKLLFSSIADAFLNIGGFSNICVIDNKILAFDICPGNLPLNSIAEKLGKLFDDGGQIAAAGKVDASVLEELNQLPYYQQNAPKSLGTEWLDAEFTKITERIDDEMNKMSTIVEHIAIQIGNTLNAYNCEKVLITGGGAYNHYLISRIKEHTSTELIIPDNNLTEFKEAIVFGLLGALHLEKIPNCLSSVTGASEDVIGGEYHLP